MVSRRVQGHIFTGMVYGFFSVAVINRHLLSWWCLEFSHFEHRTIVFRHGQWNFAKNYDLLAGPVGIWDHRFLAPGGGDPIRWSGGNDEAVDQGFAFHTDCAGVFAVYGDRECGQCALYVGHDGRPEKQKRHRHVSGQVIEVAPVFPHKAIEWNLFHERTLTYVRNVRNVRTYKGFATHGRFSYFTSQSFTPYHSECFCMSKRNKITCTNKWYANSRRHSICHILVHSVFFCSQKITLQKYTTYSP